MLGTIHHANCTCTVCKSYLLLKPTLQKWVLFSPAYRHTRKLRIWKVRWIAVGHFSSKSTWTHTDLTHSFRKFIDSCKPCMSLWRRIAATEETQPELLSPLSNRMRFRYARQKIQNNSSLKKMDVSFLITPENSWRQTVWDRESL